MENNYQLKGKLMRKYETYRCSKCGNEIEVRFILLMIF